MIEVTPQETDGVLLIRPIRNEDERGFFSETYNLQELSQHGFAKPFIQDNHAMSARKGTLRGLHFQAPPRAQHKLIRVVRGAVLDVAVDIRKGSPTYGVAVSVELSEENGAQLLVPTGFAHGYLTLTDRTDVLYKVSEGYAPEAEGGLLWCDPALAIPWNVEPAEVLVNRRDAALPALAELDSPFTWSLDR